MLDKMIITSKGGHLDLFGDLETGLYLRIGSSGIHDTEFSKDILLDRGNLEELHAFLCEILQLEVTRPKVITFISELENRWNNCGDEGYIAKWKDEVVNDSEIDASSEDSPSEDEERYSSYWGSRNR